MRRHDSLIKLSKDHHNALIAAQVIKQNSPQYRGMPVDADGKKKYILKFWVDELVPHFSAEEKILIPAITSFNSNTDKLSQRVLDEHMMLVQIILELENDTDVERTLNNFGTALENHIRFEEREWFVQIQETIPEEILKEIACKFDLATAPKKNN